MAPGLIAPGLRRDNWVGILFLCDFGLLRALLQKRNRQTLILTYYYSSDRIENQDHEVTLPGHDAPDHPGLPLCHPWPLSRWKVSKASKP